MPNLLLLGAGFSRNWGGWLALEAFEYLLGCPQVDDGLRQLLWKHRRRGGFEDALAELQGEFARNRSGHARERLNRFQGAVLQMFNDMARGFADINFEFQGQREYMVRTFLIGFDAIFTLNQDLLLERHYLDANVGLESRRWDDPGWEIPGMRVVTGGKGTSVAEENVRVSGRRQPYFKLHGSSNWLDESTGEPLLIIGGDKAAAIREYPVLRFYHDCLAKYLAAPDTRLTVIGYGFRDEHVNRTITEAAARGHLRLFIIDPLGVDVLDENRLAPIWAPGALLSALQPHVVGASRRTVREIFGSDRVEHSKVTRFLARA